MTAHPLEAMVSSFVDSPLRRLLFPYLEGHDDEDPRKQAHWMSNAYNQALGRDYPERTHPHATETKRDARHQMSPSSSSSTSLTEAMDGPWALMYFRQNSDELSDDDDEQQEQHAQAQEASRPAPTSAPASRSRRRQAADEQSQKASSRPTTQRVYTSSRNPTAHRHHRRQRSAPQPMTPAQPLPQVNTMLPLRIPPPELQAKSPLEYPANYFGELPQRTRRQRHVSASASTSELEVPRPSGSDSETSPRAYSSESDGSYHGDAGDEDPEAQLAAGIAALKAKAKSKQQQQQRATAAAASAPATVAPSTPTDPDEATDREIAQHSGPLMSSLADLFFFGSVGAIAGIPGSRGRAESCPDSPVTGPTMPNNNSNIGRSQSVDALQEPAWRRNRDAAAMLRQTSTPASLRAEVKAWASGRRSPAPASQQQSRTQRVLAALPFAYSLFGPSSLRLAETLCEDEDEAEEVGDEETTVDSAYTVRASTSRRDDDISYDSPNDDDDDADDDGINTASSTAYSSLWASPTVSRSSSAYNLDLLHTDEPSAFEEAAQVRLGEVAADQQQQRLRSLQQLRMRTLNDNGRKKAAAHSAVSPLWDQTSGSYEDSEEGQQDAGGKPYVRSWSSVVGVRGA